MNYVVQENHGEIALSAHRPTRPGPPHQSREPLYKLISPCVPHQSLSHHWIFRQHCLVSKNPTNFKVDLYDSVFLYNIFLAQKMSGKQVTNTGTNSQVSHKLSIPCEVWTSSQDPPARAPATAPTLTAATPTPTPAGRATTTPAPDTASTARECLLELETKVREGPY